MMQAVGSARLVYLVWIVGGLLSMFGAMTYAELGAMKPQAGGEYIYIRDAYGPLPAFLYAWTWFAIAKPASIATTTTGLVRILGTFQRAFFPESPCDRRRRSPLLTDNSSPSSPQRLSLAELPRREEGRRVPARLHRAEDRDDRRHRRSLLHRRQRNLEQLRLGV